MVMIFMLFFIISLINVYQKKDFLHPLLLFNAPFLIQYIVYCVFYSKQYPITLNLTILYFGSITLFNVMFLFFQNFFCKYMKSTLNDQIIYITNFTEFVAKCVGIFGVIAILYDIYIVAGHNLSFSNIYQSMRISINYGQGVSFIAKYFPVFFEVYYACYLYNGSINKCYFENKKRFVLYTIVFIFFTISTFNRTNIIMSLFVFSYVFLYFKRNQYFSSVKKFLKIILIGLLAIIGILIVFIWISKATFKMGSFDITSGEFFLWKYFGYPIVILQNRIMQLPNISHGYFLLGPFGELLRDDHFLSYLPQVGTFNVFTYLGRIYLDVGLLNCLLIQIVLSALVAFLYVKNIKRGKFYTIFFAFYEYVIFMSFYDYQYSLTIYIYILLCFIFIKFLNHFTIGRKRRKD